MLFIPFEIFICRPRSKYVKCMLTIKSCNKHIYCKNLVSDANRQSITSGNLFTATTLITIYRSTKWFKQLYKANGNQLFSPLLSRIKNRCVHLLHFRIEHILLRLRTVLNFNAFRRKHSCKAAPSPPYSFMLGANQLNMLKWFSCSQRCGWAFVSTAIITSGEVPFKYVQKKCEYMLREIMSNLLRALEHTNLI